MIYRLLRHTYFSQVRSPFWERSLIVNILLALLALYLLLNFLVLGYFLDAILGEAFPGQDIIEVANGYLLYSLLAGLLSRFLIQSFPVLHIRPYLLLPIKRTRLYHFLLLRSVLNVVNLMPLVVALPFAFKAVYHKMGPASGTAWLLAVVALSLFNHYLAFYLKRQFNLRPMMVAVLFLLLGGLVAMDVKGITHLSSVFGQGMNAILQQPVFALIPVLLLAAAYLLLYRAMQHYSYLDTVEAKHERVESGKGIAALRRLGMEGHFLQLELRQIWRNKRPKTMLLVSLFFMLYPLMLLMDDDGVNGGTTTAFIYVMIAICFPAVNYGQFLIAWESKYFNLLMSRNAPFKTYLRSKFYLFLLLNTAAFLICLFYGFIDVQFIPIVLSAYLFISGVTIYILLFFGTYNTKSVDPEKSAFMNWEGVGGSQFVMILPALFLPIVLHLPLAYLLGPQMALLVMGSIGLLGLLLQQPILNALEKQLKKRKYTLIDSFKQ
jgi:hypothetical protein